MASSSNAVGDEQPGKRQRLIGANANRDGNGEVPMRTVYIGGMTPNQINKVNSHFGQFGEIESVAMHFEDTWNEWCLVQFKRHEDAEEALLRTGNKWNGCDVKAANPWHQPDHPLQVAPDQDSDSNISVALNDDCLQAIFERLKLLSLTNVAGVCKRFNEQAKITFALKHKQLDLIEQFYDHHDLIETAMKHFGKSIQSLRIDAEVFSKEADAIRTIVQNCGPKLKHLDLCDFRFQTDSRSMRPIFAGIEDLALYDCVGNVSLNELMAGCVELKSLRIIFHCNEGQNGDLCIMQQTFPKLEEFSIHQTYVSDEMFKSFVIRHPTLIQLSISEAPIGPSVFRTIGQHAKNLQEWELIRNRYNHNDNDEQFQNDAAFISQLSSLKKLHLDLDAIPLLAVLNAFVAGSLPIECLEIWFVNQPIEDAVQCISKLERIKVLKLRTNRSSHLVTDAHVIKVAKCFPELEELHLDETHMDEFDLYYGFKSQLSTIGLRKMLMHAIKLKLLKLRSIDGIKIDVDDYKAMLSTVQERKEKVPLMIEIVHGKKDQVDVPVAILAENRSTFNIKEA